MPGHTEMEENKMLEEKKIAEVNNEELEKTTGGIGMSGQIRDRRNKKKKSPLTSVTNTGIAPHDPLPPTDPLTNPRNA